LSVTEPILTVAELARRLRRAAESITGNEWVQGEVSSLRRAASGHAYFCLKDEQEDAVIECVLYRFQIERAAAELRDGARIQVWGRATVWPPRGRLQLVIERVRPIGRGALLLALDRLKQKLCAEGLFDPSRKRPLPTQPRLIGVVTSAQGAAVHDIVTVAFRRGRARFVLSPAQVQGDGAAESLVRALDLVEELAELDVLIVGRGGGSGEDLMAFNDERVVRRIASTRVPVVSAVGHETDVTLTDLVADVRAATPSQAAELIIIDHAGRREQLRRARLELCHAAEALLGRERDRVGRLQASLTDPRFLIAERQEGLDEATLRLERFAQRLIARRRSQVEQSTRRLIGRHPRVVLARARVDLGPLRIQLLTTLRFCLERSRAELRRQSDRLQALSPLQVLTRGYAIVECADGRVLRRTGDVTPGDSLSIRLVHGRIGATVVGVEDERRAPMPGVDPPSSEQRNLG
jgi:exodeoxyribonuclease VII large subunit